MIETPQPATASPDPDDNWILAIAELGSAHYLVSGDLGDLGSLKRHAGTRVLTARDFVRQILKD